MLKSCWARLAVLTLTVFLSTQLTAGATILSFSPATPGISGVGGTLNLSVGISDVKDLYAYQFDITFDPAILSATAITEGTFLAAGGGTTFFPGAIDNVNGLISFTANALSGLVPGVSGAGQLAEIQFAARAVGSSLVSFSNAVLLDSAFGDIVPDVLSVANVAVVTAAVPLPGTVWLMLVGGLVGVGVTRLRGSNDQFRFTGRPNV